MAELEDLSRPFEDVALGSYRSCFVDDAADAAARHPSLKRYLCYFIHRYLEFRIPEVEALAELAVGSRPSGDGQAGAPAVVWERPAEGLASPLWYAHLPSDEVVQQVAPRSMLTKVFLEVWGEGGSWEELFESIRAYPQHLKAPYTEADESFRFVVDHYGAKLSMAEQVAVVEKFDWMPMKGPIDLRNPKNKFWVLIVDTAGRPNTNLMPLPFRLIFGREVALGDRSVIPQYELKRRRYLGPTSMDTEMAFIMANMGRVGRSSLVMDPFVGTGSILVAAAARGAMTMGTDIDVRVIKFGKQDKSGNKVNVWTNFFDYGLQPPLGLLRADLHRPPVRDGLEEVLGAVVCDPPYGVRAGGRKSASRDYTIEDRATHITSTDEYSLGECMRDLLDLSARLLVLGGRLVFFMPSVPGWYDESHVPTHPMLRLVANSEQILTTRYSRRLVTLEKVRRYDAAEVASFHEAQGPPRDFTDELREHVYAPRPGGGSDADSSSGGQGGAALRSIPKHRAKTV